jgi:hypothetical protein
MSTAVSIVHATWCIVEQLSKGVPVAPAGDLRRLQSRLQSLRAMLEEQEKTFADNLVSPDSGYTQRLIVLLTFSRTTIKELHDYVVVSIVDKRAEAAGIIRPFLRLLSAATGHLLIQCRQASVTNLLQPQASLLAYGPVQKQRQELGEQPELLPSCVWDDPEDEADVVLLGSEQSQPARFVPVDIQSSNSQISSTDKHYVYISQEHDFNIFEILLQEEHEADDDVPPGAKASCKLSASLNSQARYRNFEEHLRRVHRVGSAMEYYDCAAWLLEHKRSQLRIITECHQVRHSAQSRSGRDQNQDQDPCESLPRRLEKHDRPLSPVDIFPTHAGQRHFAVRAACCVLAAFRTLTIAELFAATTTKILPTDPDWPRHFDDISKDMDELMFLCRSFLLIDAQRCVHLQPWCFGLFHSAAGLVAMEDARLFLSLACLNHLKKHPRLILKPWLDFYELVADEEKFGLHRYAITYWQRHCVEIEGTSGELPRELHSVIQGAWLAERSAESVFCTCRNHEELDITIQSEALNVGLELSIAHGFDLLAETYRRMGARSVQTASPSTRSNGSRTPSCDPSSVHSVDCDDRHTQTDGHGADVFDLWEWQFIDPFCESS